MAHTIQIKINTPEAEKERDAMSKSGAIEIVAENNIPKSVQEESLRRLHLMKTQNGYALSEEEFIAALNEDDE